MLSGLLIVNFAVLAVIMLRPSPAVQQAGVAEPAAAAPEIPQTSAPLSAAPQPVAPQATATPMESASPQPAVQQRTVQSPAPADEPVATVAAEEPPAERVASGLPSLNDLQAQGVLQLPEMHLDIHVFSGQPAERFVFVNMKKYTEGATLSEGPAVREITREGVVLDYLGTRFLLPRE